MTGMEPKKGLILKKTLLFLAAAVFASSSFAEVLEPTPKACSLLADVGLKGRKWVDDYGDGSSGCASDYKEIGSATGLANNLGGGKN